MTAVVEVLEPGVAVTIQDRGRFGYRSIGVPVSGALDPVLMAIANALVGNPADAAVLEIGLAGPTLRAATDPVRVALAGEVGATWIDAGGESRPVRPWHTATLERGDLIRVGRLARGVACLGLSGGVQVVPQLRSRSTYTRARLGGVDGRALARGDRLPCGAQLGEHGPERRGAAPWVHPAGPIRVIVGPQDDHFTAAALAAFFATAWRVTRDLDRMGMRLEGPALAHNDRGADIVSDAVAPGAIQVPASGQPILLLADCQTVGGYPKIATVIQADLPRLAHLRPGEELRFAAVDHARARAALDDQTRRLAGWIATIEPFVAPGSLDMAALHRFNLVSGGWRGDEADPEPGAD
jgi:biotin-dependent carboxylase-like uncharacterized protein